MLAIVCPKCDSNGELTSTEKIALFHCINCKYSRAHSITSIFQELYLDYCEFHQEKPSVKVTSKESYEAQIKTAVYT